MRSYTYRSHSDSFCDSEFWNILGATIVGKNILHSVAIVVHCILKMQPMQRNLRHVFEFVDVEWYSLFESRIRR